MKAGNYLPTKARITVSNGAAGNEMAVLNSNICSKSTVRTIPQINIKCILIVTYFKLFLFVSQIS